MSTDGSGRWVGNLMCTKSLQSCPILCDPIDTVPLQAPLSMGSLGVLLPPSSSFESEPEVFLLPGARGEPSAVPQPATLGPDAGKD